MRYYSGLKSSAFSRNSISFYFYRFSAFFIVFELLDISTNFLLVATSCTLSFLASLKLFFYLFPALSLPLIFFFLFFIFFESFSYSSTNLSFSMTSLEALSIVPMLSGRIVIVCHGIFSRRALTSFSCLYRLLAKILTSNLNFKFILCILRVKISLTGSRHN